MNIRKFDFQKIYLIISLFACYFNVLVFPFSNYITLTFQVASVLFGFYLVFKQIKNKKIVVRKNVYILFLILLASSFYSFFFNEFGWSVGGLTSIISRILMVTCLYIINNNDDYERIFEITICFSSVLMVINDVLYLAGIGAMTGRKFTGIFSNPQPGGAVALISIIISMYYIYNKKGYKYMNITCFITSLFYLLQSKNRTAYFALFCLVAISLFIKMSKRNKVIFGTISIFFAIFLLLFFIKNISLSHDINQYTELEHKLYSLSSARYGIYKDAVGIFMKRPIFGISCYNEIEAALKILGSECTIYLRDYEFSHNIFSEVVLHGGLFSLAPFCIFIFMLLKNSLKKLGACTFLSYETIFPVLVVVCFFYSQLDSGISGYMLFTSYFFWIGCQRTFN